MGIQIGEVDVASQILDNEYRIMVLERVVDRLIQRFPVIGGPISPTEMDEIRRSVVKLLQQKYPNSGITLKEGSSGG
jgi:hypothetical protein